MITADMIPDEVWHTAMSVYHKTIRKNPGHAWQMSISAALNAWPGAFPWTFNGPLEGHGYILPLPQKDKQ